MDYKLIALDIDGTLLDDQKEIPGKVRETLKKAYGKGFRIALLSGRMPAAVELIEKKLGIPCVKACNAGTCVILDSGETFMDFIGAQETAAVYHEVAEKYHVPLWVYRNRSWMVTAIDSYVQYESRIIQYEPELIDMDQRCLCWKAEDTGPNKLLFGTEPMVLLQILCDMELFRARGLDFARSADIYLEIYPRGATKGKALHTICQALGIHPEDTIAFGDQELDLPLLEAAGCSVAMGNAIPRLKECADFVTKSNNEAGVAVALQQLLGL